MQNEKIVLDSIVKVRGIDGVLFRVIHISIYGFAKILITWVNGIEYKENLIGSSCRFDISELVLIKNPIISNERIVEEMM